MRTYENLLIGTCSWNYKSWTGLVYASAAARAADYLPEYSKKYRTVEIDSWFYKYPTIDEVLEYKNLVDEDFRFTCKVPRDLTLVHLPYKKDEKQPKINPNFLNNEKFDSFLTAIDPLLPQMDAVMLEFEYLNKQKMQSVDKFIRALDDFIQFIPADIPVSIETRNANYLTSDYFSFLKHKNIAHVFSEKIYMPHIYDLYPKIGGMLTDRTVLRLLGGDRKAIEDKSKKKWDTLVEPKADLGKIIEMTKDLISSGKRVTINVNNHYEGSAPLTINSIFSSLEAG